MEYSRFVEKKDIRKWMYKGLALFAIGIINTVAGFVALRTNDACPGARPILIRLVGGTVLLLFFLALAFGIRYIVKYYRYKRYFEATGLRRCTEDNIARWQKTRDVTQ